MKEINQLRKWNKENRRASNHRCPLGKHIFIKGECACGYKKQNCIVRNKSGQGTHLEYRNPVELQDI
jgi:hypothetical protein